MIPLFESVADIFGIDIVVIISFAFPCFCWYLFGFRFVVIIIWSIWIPALFTSFGWFGTGFLEIEGKCVKFRLVIEEIFKNNKFRKMCYKRTFRNLSIRTWIVVNYLWLKIPKKRNKRSIMCSHIWHVVIQKYVY